MVWSMIMSNSKSTRSLKFAAATFPLDSFLGINSLALANWFSLLFSF